MAMQGRKYSAASGYRYGFNGKENDNEVKGESSQQDYGLRIYDPRLGKFLSVDPLTGKYPWYTPYQFAGNDVIRNVDLDGGEPKGVGKECGEYGVAPVQDSKDKTTYGWIWDSDTKRWGKGSSLLFKNGTTSSEEAIKNDKDGDLKSSDNPKSPNLNITRLKTTVSDAELFAKFKTGLAVGTAGVNSGVGKLIADIFGSGGGVDEQASFANGYIVPEVARDAKFIAYANKFEKKALEYFRDKKTLEGFDGNIALENRVQFTDKRPLVGTSLFLQTLIGGTQGASAMITKITASEIKVTYNIYDVFGAGKTDAGRWGFPGLQAMYILQHYRNTDEHSKGFYKPFFWRVEVKR